MLKMFDSVSNSGIMDKLSTASRYWTFVSNFMADMALFIFATFLMDAILQTWHRSKFVMNDDLSIPTIDESAMMDEASVEIN